MLTALAALAALATPLPPTAAGWQPTGLVRPSWTTPPRPYRAPLALYTSDACVGHQPSSRTKPHPEQPERLANLLRALQHGQGAVLRAGGTAPARIPRLLRAHLAALGGVALPGMGAQPLPRVLEPAASQSHRSHRG